MSRQTSGGQGPHAGQPVLVAGAPLKQARAAMILIHGRGASAEDILSLADELAAPELVYLAPQAAHSAWYPNRFIAPVASNEPWLSSALAVVSSLLAQVAAAGIPAERTLLLGFSQGACLALEFVARNPARYGGVLALSGALIENGDQSRGYSGSLADTPILLGCSDVDFHIPRERVERSAKLLQEQGASVDLRLYPGMGHTVNQDELTTAQAIVRDVLAG